MADTDTSAPFDLKFSLPGYNLPINFKPHAPMWKRPGPKGEEKDLFPNALDTEDAQWGKDVLRLTPLRELTMMDLMDEITDKPDWDIKVFDEAIVSTWMAEALNSDQDITERMVDWCIEELRYKAKGFKKTGFVVAYDGDVVKSDTAISPEIKQALREAVSPLENVPDYLKDWHPGSNGKVLDLVHPSLFPLVYGRSRILENKTTTLEDFVRRTGEGMVLPVPPAEQMIIPSLWESRFRQINPARPFSRTFQWLPCDVELSENGKDVKIISYINNLHPFDHKKLYGVIEQTIARTIPLWNQVLTHVKPMLGEGHWHRIEYDRVTYDPDPEYGPSEDGPQQEDDEDDNDYYQRRREWYRETREVVLPEPGDFTPPESSRIDCYYDEDGLLKGNGPVDIFRDYRHRGLQVIVKLANIHLTPEKPEYEGGSWHVEGQLNEHICASAIYYYDNENITTSHLSFRHKVAHDSTFDISYEQGHYDWLEDVFGCKNNEPTIQELGSVITSEGRLLAWPNVLQHQVQPFKLADSTKPGHRKILALFLVDPHIRIISTANIASQRKDWWAAHVQGLEDSVGKLPVELQDKIYKDIDFPLTMEEAKELRLKLMEERSRYVDRMGRVFTQHSFSLCEH